MSAVEKHPYSMHDVVAYHDDQMAPEARVAFEAHLRGCRECRKALDAAAETLRPLDASIEKHRGSS
jgi:predicted anti-sigma-YlaC factor YlaD